MWVRSFFLIHYNQKPKVSTTLDLETKKWKRPLTFIHIEIIWIYTYNLLRFIIRGNHSGNPSFLRWKKWAWWKVEIVVAFLITITTKTCPIPFSMYSVHKHIWVSILTSPTIQLWLMYFVLCCTWASLLFLKDM